MKKINFLLILIFTAPVLSFSQNVGIGTSNPQGKFHVETNDPFNSIGIFKNISGYSSLWVTNNSQHLFMGVTPTLTFVGTASYNDFGIQSGGYNRILIEKVNGYVGIGTLTPATTLHVVAPTPVDQIARFDAAGSANGYIRVGTANNAIDLGSDVWKSFLSTTGTQDLVIKLNGTERMHIKAVNGNVGIGTDMPVTKLHVLGNTYLAGTLVTVSDVTMLTNLSVNGNLAVGNIVQADRIPVTWFSDNFHNLGAPYEDVTYYMDKENRVHLSGVVEIVGTQTGTIFILPTGCRPIGNQVFAAMTSSGNVNRINVNSSGNVTIQGNLSGWVSMDGISFRAN